MSQPISSAADYEAYLEADRIQLGISRRRPHLWGDDIWKFQRLLRKLEFYLNCKRGPWRIYRWWLRREFHRQSIRLGFQIPPNVFGPGLSIAHYGSITVHPQVRVGRNCRLHICVNIGTAAGTQESVPRIGDDVYIGPGAKIFGPITIADGVVIGANAVVHRSVETPNVTIGGVPARKIADKGRAEVSPLLQDRSAT